MLARIAPALSRAAAARAAAPASVRFYSKPTASEEAAKHDDHSLSPEELAKRTTQQAQQSQGGEQGGATHSEEAVKGANHDKSPEQLQKETAGKA
ncbi:hypothetical protein FA09DRAFT_336564 [Tilletiopsis washingtonensis]|uniref:Uncharacterized protein n=1 Tax=Tilletiopsis washingtonensis TaxID=58919 RepID=A0A316ZFZ6_9BASI|nr:hypothetical protein FA09DRAFT_336564 [Tilletiopsis washingtonensis]PWO00432.1 hypothetical protein FA09DRAFT_336564 [Tilletiopsis washingtonensis]